MEAALDASITGLPVEHVVVTRGADGVHWHHRGETKEIASVPVSPVDTTGAGDTFAGYLIACLDRGQPYVQALTTANRAAAIMVTRHGTADVIPDLKDLEDFRFG